TATLYTGMQVNLSAIPLSKFAGGMVNASYMEKEHHVQQWRLKRRLLVSLPEGYCKLKLSLLQSKEVHSNEYSLSGDDHEFTWD
ncbi:hypothetical protein EJB05_43924, partial [Eragrostis curvula]